MTDPTTDPDPDHVRTISDSDARAIAKALFAEASRQVLMATGRGVWGALKTMFFPVLIGVLMWWLATQGKPIALPTGGS